MIILWIVLIAVLIVVAVRMAQNRDTGMQAGGSSHDTPLDILKKRYARGEIDKQEFEQKKKDLQ